MDMNTVFLIMLVNVWSFTAVAQNNLPCTELTESITGQQEILLECVVNQGQYLDYRQLREMTQSRSDGVKFNVSISCFGGKVFISWPFRARNVVSLEVNGCKVEGFLDERITQQTGPDELKNLIMIDTIFEISVQELYDSMLNLQNMTKAFECGPTNLERHVFSNIRYVFPADPSGFSDLLLMEKLLSGDGLKALLLKDSNCAYPSLKYLEQSGSDAISSIHFKLVESSKYPELRTYSSRNNSLGRIPAELRDLHFSFLPKLRNLDLSYNNIENLNFDFPGISPRRSLVYVDMRNNNIRRISGSLVHQLAKSNNVVIDIRNNPVVCSCQLHLYGIYLRQLSMRDANLNQYRDITCVQAGSMTTRNLLDQQFGQDMCSNVV